MSRNEDGLRVARPWLRPLAAAAVILRLAAGAAPVAASAVPGFVENWSAAGDLRGWGAQLTTFTNPGSGGTGGASDGYLLLATTLPNHLGGVSFGSQYTGDWIAAGISGVKLWLNDVGTADPLEIHFSLGNGGNFWQYNQGFSPPHNQWQEYVVDLTSAVGWTRTIGSGTFDQALRSVDRVHVRHDTAPYTSQPPDIQADFGMDQLTLTSENVPVLPDTWGRIKALYR